MGPARLTLPHAFRWIYIVLNKDAQHRRCVNKGECQRQCDADSGQGQGLVGGGAQGEDSTMMVTMEERRKRSVGLFVFYPGIRNDCWRAHLALGRASTFA